MLKLLTCVGLILGLFGTSAAVAGEQTVTLAVKNMDCATCPFTVKASLEAVPGVTKVVVSLRWPRLSEQIFRVDKWSLCRVRLPSGGAAG